MKHELAGVLIGFGEPGDGAELYYRALCSCGHKTSRYCTTDGACKALDRAHLRDAK